jgi:hypothetical protein
MDHPNVDEGSIALGCHSFGSHVQRTLSDCLDKGYTLYIRISDDGNAAMQFADRKARQLNHANIGTELLLLGILEGRSGIGVTALQKMGVDLEKIRDRTLELAVPLRGEKQRRPLAKRDEYRKLMNRKRSHPVLTRPGNWAFPI